MVPDTAKGSNAPLVSVIVVLVLVAVGFGYTYVTTSAKISSLQSSTASLGAQVVSLDSITAEQQSSISSIGSITAEQQSSISFINSITAEQQSSISSIYVVFSEQASSIASLEAQLTTPTLTIWTASRNIPLDSVLYETVPDTFDYNDVWTSSSPVTVYYLTVKQASEFFSCTVTPVSSCVSGTYESFGPATSSNDVFRLAEGCGGYVAVYQPSGKETVTFTPNISITYHPASTATGACA